MKIGLCCIGRLENRYIKEFVQFYINLGVDKIFIYDNNYDGEEYFEDELKFFISNGFVKIIDFRNKQKCQLEAYQDCYDKYGKEYDWFCFFDIDEFLLLNNSHSIKDVLSSCEFKNYDMIHVNWVTFSDNNLVRYDNRPILKRFTEVVLPLDFKKNYNIPENCHVKSIIRGGLEIKWSNTPHTPSNEIKCCDSAGNPCNSSMPFIVPYVYGKMCLRHFPTKTIEEWLNIKVKRGYPDGHKDYFRTHDAIEEFFLYNKQTNEKYRYIWNIDEDNVDIFVGTYKVFNMPFKNFVYKVIYGKHNLFFANNIQSYKCVSDEILDDKFYSEIYMLKNLPKDLKLKKYVGFCHYRKWFEFLDNIPDMDVIFKEYDVVAAVPFSFTNLTVREHYAKYHNVEDLDIVENIIKEKFTDYYESFETVMNGRKMYPFNMFIMKKEDFLEYISFISAVLNEYVKIVGTDIEKRIKDNVDKYLKSFEPNSTIEYQYRIGGYLAERLTSVFINKKFNKVKKYRVKITEEKY